ncbi:MAG: porphobilinogen synthase [Candidatus Caenarcaniphilales bacterium]|nr:porphobilinogen synthase [Candidatus Caenarcaniphilales bacterium]
MLIRPRRLRQARAIRDLVQENNLSVNDFIYPMFIKDEQNAYEEIQSMPGIHRFGGERLLYEVEELLALGIKSIVLFPLTSSELKNSQAIESYNANNLTCRTIRALKKRFPELLVMTDIALDPYTDHGHDGIIVDGKIANDETVKVLCKMALAQAEAGADILGPSDMMDGRVKAIRQTLEAEGHNDVMILSYTAKYASSLYGPFRDAVKSANYGIDESIPRDKKTYQMNIANSDEALREMQHDIDEGADILMIKPAGWYLDIISRIKTSSNIPVAAYQVSGEYSMILAAVKAGLMKREQAIYESLLSIKRAGADLILSYFAKELFSM